MMLVWLLILTLNGSGKAIATVQVADRDSCERAGTRFVASLAAQGGMAWYSCTQIKIQKDPHHGR